MKSTVRKRTVRIVSILFTISVVLAVSPSTFGCPLPASFYTNDSVLVHKRSASKKCKIKIYPNAERDVLFFNARGVDGKVYQLYLFDMEGKLVKQANIKNKQTTIVDNIEKGSYLFEVFSDDERIENGQVTIL
jgi:hypothetical protein